VVHLPTVGVGTECASAAWTGSDIETIDFIFVKFKRLASFI